MGQGLGVLGGTFDPVHVGHVVVAATARRALGLDRVLLVVANQPWQKAGRVVASARDRYDMAVAAADGVEGVEASSMEIERGGDSFMADTLEVLAGEDPGRPLYLVVGADVAGALDTWERPEVVRRLARLALVDRAEPGSVANAAALRRLLEARGWSVATVDVPRLDISSSELRRRVAAGLGVDGLVPPPVASMITRRGLYA